MLYKELAVKQFFFLNSLIKGETTQEHFCNSIVFLIIRRRGEFCAVSSFLFFFINNKTHEASSCSSSIKN